MYAYSKRDYKMPGTHWRLVGGPEECRAVFAAQQNTIANASLICELYEYTHIVVVAIIVYSRINVIYGIEKKILKTPQTAFDGRTHAYFMLTVYE